MSDMRPAPLPGDPQLVVEDLHVRFRTPQRMVHAVRGVSFSVGREKVGIVGESGSGKSQTGRAILKLTPPNGTVSARRLQFQELDIAGASEREMLKVRGSRISMIMQDPKYALDPVMRVGAQIAEAIAAHQTLPKSAIAKAQLLHHL